MNDKPTPEQIAKLPKWAQDHLTNLERERGEAVRAMNRHIDNQKPSKIYWDRYLSTGEAEKGPTSKRFYVQNDSLTFESAGVLLRVACHEDTNMHYPGIELQWTDNHGIGNMIAAVPTSFQSMALIAQHNMRVRQADPKHCKKHEFGRICVECGLRTSAEF